MNLAILAERNVENFGEYVSLVFEGSELTNAQLLERARRLARGLVDLGIRPGDRVGVLLPNSPDVGVSYGGILRCGATVMPVVFLLAVPEISHILADSGAAAIVTSSEFYPNVKAALEPLERRPIVIVTGDGPFEEGVVPFESLIAGASEPLAIVDRSSDDLAVVSYTSGTTGRPKGVMLTHGNLLFQAENSAKVSPTRDGDISVVTLPLAHLFGLGSSLTGQLFRTTGVLLRWFTPDGFFDAVDRYRPTSSALVPTMISYLLAHPHFDQVDWESFRWCVVGAAPVPLDLAEEFEKRTNSRVLEGYGLTETSPTVALVRLEDQRRPGSCGKPVPNVDVSILDDEGRPVPAGQPGEVCVRGPNVMKGYYNLPEETAAVLRDGWLHTGDVGMLDEDGYLYITERKKDLIIRGGFNIYPRDVEEVLYRHPAVQECAVVGVPDAHLGEEVKAYVVLRPGAQATEDELLAFCSGHLAAYKTPKSLSFLDALPKNPVGKILKKDLRERARAEAGA